MDPGWRAWDWKRIGTYLEAERGTRSRPDVAAAIGASSESVYNVEIGRPPKRRKPPTAVALAALYGWTPESLEAVGNGGEPTKIAPPVLDTKSAIAAAGPLAPDEEFEVASILNSNLSDEMKVRAMEWWLQQRRPAGAPEGSNDAAS